MVITDERIAGFEAWLRSEEREASTIRNYVRDITALKEWLTDRDFSKENVLLWKETLIESGLRPVTVNAKLAAVNTFFRFIGENCKIRFLKIQKKVFCDADKNLTKAEYERLVQTAKEEGKTRLALLMETIGATGIRVSEVQYITVQAALDGKTQIRLKGKVRTILLPGKLCRKLLQYAKKNRIASGEIFITGSGKSLSRKQIWAEMKAICAKAGVESSKVFPHNLRHLFAKVFYKVTKDVAKLADLLGHSSIETTRIYLLSTGEEHARELERVRLGRVDKIIILSVNI